MGSQKVLHLYRLLRRTAAKTFGEDTRALTAAYSEIRKHFVQNAHVTDSKSIATLLAEGLEAAQFLAQSVVQGKLNERGNFEIQNMPDVEGRVDFKEPAQAFQALGERETPPGKPGREA